MRVSKLLGPDLRKTLQSEPEVLPEVLAELHPEDIAEMLTEDLAERDIMVLIDALQLETAADVLYRLPAALCLQILEHLGPMESAGLLTEMADDDRADLVQELPAGLRDEILLRIEEREPGVAQDVRALTAYDDESAGGIMTTDYLALWPELTIARSHRGGAHHQPRAQPGDGLLHLRGRLRQAHRRPVPARPDPWRPG